MDGPPDRNGLETLSRPTCLLLLRNTAVGRIGISVDAMPVILPVNFAVARCEPDDDDMIILQATSGAKVEAALQNNVVAFEADGYDAMNHSGWSVLVQGSSRVVIGPAEQAWAATLPLQPWALTDAPFFVAITIDLVSGRRFGVPQRTKP